MKFKIILASLCISCLYSSAQFNESIRTGRPGQAIDPFAVGMGVFQTETGFDIAGFNNSKKDYSGLSYIPNTVLRFGVGKRVDVNAMLEYRSETFEQYRVTYSQSGLSYSSLGARINFSESSGNRPSLGMQMSIKLPILSEAYNSKYLAPKIILVGSEKISERLGLVLNLGIDYDGNSPKPQGLYVINLAYTLSDILAVFVENYLSFTEDYFEPRFDVGLGYLMNKNLQLDIYGGYSFHENRANYFGSIGFSWRIFNRKDSGIRRQ